MKRIFALLAPCAAALTFSVCMGQSVEERLDALEKRIAALEQQDREPIEKQQPARPQIDKQQPSKLHVEKQQLTKPQGDRQQGDRLSNEDQLSKAKESARARMRQDSKVYSEKELADIEALYQVANEQWDSAEAKESLKKLIAEYPKSNRTGCAVLYMGQMSKGDEAIRYLQRAINEFSDCAYGDGVVVGAFARYCLAMACWKKGDRNKAQRLVDEIKAKYPDAVAHNGKPLSLRLDTSSWR